MDGDGDKAVLVVYESKWRRRIQPKQRYRWRLVHQNGNKLAHGGEGYAHEDECERMGLRVCTGFYADKLHDGGFEVYGSKGVLRAQRFRWRLRIGSRIIAVPGEGYTHRSECTEAGRKLLTGGYDVSVLRA